MVLGTAQDAGYPQAHCQKACCALVRESKRAAEPVVSLALVDPESSAYWLFEATPDIAEQMQTVEQKWSSPKLPAGVFVSHAHIGHYTGLMYFGREAMGAKQLPVYAMPRMWAFLEQNGPWSQSVKLENIVLKPLKAMETVQLNARCSVLPILVPHRDEFSETVGFAIYFGDKSALFIPDIDKWQKWNQNLTEWVQKVDWAFVDATFYDGDELPGRNMAEIPHPFVVETMSLLDSLPKPEKAKVHFIHFNHTNPLLQPTSAASVEVERIGFGIARTGMVFR